MFVYDDDRCAKARARASRFLVCVKSLAAKNKVSLTFRASCCIVARGFALLHNAQMRRTSLCAALCVTLTAAKLAPPTHSAVKLAPRKASHPVAKAPVARISSGGATKTLELLFGAGGIYAAFLYYGSLQEDVFR